MARIFIALALLFTGCSATTREADVRALRRLHDESLRAHREGDWRWFGEGVADDYVAGSRGELVRPTRVDTLERFRDYLQRTEFTAYHDVAEPVVHVSEDGTMGWVLAQVHVEGVQDAGSASEETIDSTWTWVSIFEKRQGQWLRVANVSNCHEGPPVN